MKKKLLIIASFLAITFGTIPNAFGQWTQSKEVPSSITANCLVADGSIVYAGFGSTYDTNSGYFNGILYSTDHGESWTGLGDSWNKLGIGPISTPVFTIAAQGSTIFAGGGAVLWRSTDSGATWTRLQLRYGYGDLESLAINGSNLFASTREGLIRSTDSGSSWKVLTDSSYGPLAFIGSKIYAGSNYQGLLVSTDNGDDWTIVGLPFGTSVSSIAVSGANIAVLDYANYPNQFVAFSSDSGHTWMETLIPYSVEQTGSLILNGQNIFGANFGISAGSLKFYSTDKGKSWIDLPSTAGDGRPNAVSCIVVSGDNFILSSENSGLWYYSLGSLAVKTSVETHLNISLSPNPTTGIITVHNAPVNVLHVTIMNVLGETVSELTNLGTKQLTIDISEFPQGTYFARFSSDGSVITRKIIKE